MKNKKSKLKIGKIITITSGKGGVGKTTVAANVGKGFSLLGYKTLLVDLDIGLKNLDILLNITEENLKYDLIDLMNNEVSIDKSIDKIEENLYYLSAFQKYDKSFLDLNKIDNLFTLLKKKFDVIIIDSPAGIENGFLQSISISDHILLVVNPDIASVRDTSKVIDIIKKENKNIKNNINVKINLIINKYLNEDYSLSIEDIENNLQFKPFSIINYNEEMVYYYNKGMPAISQNEEFQFLTNRLEESVINNLKYEKIIEKYPLNFFNSNNKTKELELIIEKQKEIITLNEEKIDKYEKIEKEQARLILEQENIEKKLHESIKEQSEILNNMESSHEEIMEEVKIKSDLTINDLKKKNKIVMISFFLSISINVVLTLLLLLKGKI